MTPAVSQLDPRTAAYVDDVLHAVEEHVPIVEAYVVGSGATGVFDPRTSDVDVVAVVERALGSDRRRVIDAVRSLPCPVRDLELVLYVEGGQPPHHELNLDHGEESGAEPFWFVLDAALAQGQAAPLLHGRPWSDVFEPVTTSRLARPRAHRSRGRKGASTTSRARTRHARGTFSSTASG